MNVVVLFKIKEREMKPELELANLQAYHLELFRICEKQLTEVSRLQKSLKGNVDVSDLYNPLLDIRKELK